jgi:hypothetical protein
VRSRIRASGIVTIIIGLLLVSPRAPAADTEPPGAEPGTEPAPGPWQEGVSPADQDAAKVLFEEAVTMQRQWLLADAVARYEQALARWEHPKIRFYLSRTQEKMGDLVAAYENLRLALRWGLDAFPPEDAEVVREMQRRLEAALSRIEVRCDEPGAEVFIDGKPWFVAPGGKQAVVRPGEHAVIARKAGFFTVTRSISVVPGKHATVDIGLSPETIVRGRWEGWQSWHTGAVVATGAALALAGGVLEWQAVRDYEDYERRFRVACDDPHCTPHQDHPDMADRLRRARWENRGAIAAFGAAGAAVAVGAMLGWLDQPRPHRNQATGAVGVELTPLVTSDAAGVSLGGHF